jgi:hypothetical protein
MVEIRCSNSYKSYSTLLHWNRATEAIRVHAALDRRYLVAHWVLVVEHNGTSAALRLRQMFWMDTL